MKLVMTLSLIIAFSDCTIGEIHSDIAAKKYLEKVASDQVHMPPKYMWLLQLYNVNQTYIIQWYNYY